MRVRFSFILDIDSADDYELQQCMEAAQRTADQLDCTMSQYQRELRCCVQQVDEEATK